MANYAIYPMKNLRITQDYNGSTSHKPHNTGTPKDYPIDEGGKDGGKESVYCPCDEIIIKRVYGVGNSGVNTVFWQSTSKVIFADGTTDYLCGLYTHTNDTDLGNVKVGKKFKRGEIVCKEGTDGNVGMHIHMSFGKGTLTGNGWTANSKGKYVLSCTNGAFKPEQLLYIDKSFTNVINNKGLAFKTMPVDSPKSTTNTSATSTNSSGFLPQRGYFKKGDISPNIGKIAKFMYETFPAYTPKAALGNIFGDNLLKAIKEFQKRSNLEPDGYIGRLTLDKLKQSGFKE